MMVLLSGQPNNPFWGRLGKDPRAGRYDKEDAFVLALSLPISKCADANEYVSEKTRGRRGILDRKPHLEVAEGASSSGLTCGD
jgi:hypothetical protein